MGKPALFACMALLAAAAGAEPLRSGDFTYELAEGGRGAIVTGYDGTETSVVIPDRLGGVPVLVLDVYSGGESCFKDCTDVTLPQTLTRIGNACFLGAARLERVELPQGLTIIGSAAFCGSGITELDIPPSVQFIGTKAFAGSALRRVSVPAATMPDKAERDFDAVQGSQFMGCARLSEVTLAEGLESLPRDCFRGCHALQRVRLPESLRKIGSGAFYETDLVEVELPASASRQRIEFGFSQFRRDESRLTVSPHMTLRNKIALRNAGYEIPIDESDFYWANKSDFDYSSGHDYTAQRQEYTYIYDLSDDGRTVAIQQYLGTEQHLIIPAELEGYRVTEVSLCRLDEQRRQPVVSVQVPATVRRLGAFCFYNCKDLVSVELPDGLLQIGDSAFYSASSLTALRIPETVRAIGNTAFSGTSLREIELPPRLVSIGSSAFSGTLIKKIVLPDTVRLTAPVFGGAKRLEEVVLPEGATEIPADCFGYCIALRRVEIPGGVTTIGERAFESCTSLGEIGLPAALRQVGKGAFAGCKSLRRVHVPQEARAVQGDGGYPFADSPLIPATERRALQELFAPDPLP